MGLTRPFGFWQVTEHPRAAVGDLSVESLELLRDQVSISVLVSLIALVPVIVAEVQKLVRAVSALSQASLDRTWKAD